MSDYEVLDPQSLPDDYEVLDPQSLPDIEDSDLPSLKFAATALRSGISTELGPSWQTLVQKIVGAGGGGGSFTIIESASDIPSNPEPGHYIEFVRDVAGLTNFYKGNVAVSEARTTQLFKYQDSQWQFVIDLATYLTFNINLLDVTESAAETDYLAIYDESAQETLKIKKSDFLFNIAEGGIEPNDLVIVRETAYGTPVKVGSATQYGISEDNMNGLAFINNTLYGVGSGPHNNRRGRLYTIDTTTGVATQVGADNFGLSGDQGKYPSGMDFHKDTLYVFDNQTDRLLNVNYQTGDATIIGGWTLSTAEYDPQGLGSVGGDLYFAGRVHDALYRINLTTNSAERVSNVEKFGLDDVAVGDMAAVHGILFMTDDHNDKIYRVNHVTGIATDLGIPAGLGLNATELRGMAANETDLYVTDNTTDSLYRIPFTVREKRIAISEIAREPFNFQALIETYSADDEDKISIQDVSADEQRSIKKSNFLWGNTNVKDSSNSDSVLVGSLSIGTTKTRIGNADKFGINAHWPNPLEWVGDTLFSALEVHRQVTTVNPLTGVATRVGTVEDFGVTARTVYIRDYAYNSTTDILYAVDYDGYLYTVNRSTGVFTEVGSMNGPRNYMGASFVNNTLYVADSQNDAFYSVNTTTGNATRIGTVSQFGVGVDFPTALFTINNEIYMGERNGKIVHIDAESGVGRVVTTVENISANQVTWAYKPGDPIIYGTNVTDDYLYTVPISYSTSLSKISDVISSQLSKASKDEAEDGIDNTKYMTPLRTKEAIDANDVKHQTQFSALDGDVIDRILDGSIGFYNDTTQLQSGGLSQLNTVYIPDRGATLGQNVQSPTVPLSAVDNVPLMRDRFENGGAVICAFMAQGDHDIFYVRANTIEKANGGWKLTNVVTHGSHTFSGSGIINWNVVISETYGVFQDDVIGLSARLSLYVLKTDLEGKETDRYASYTNAFIAATGDRRGSICLFTASTGPPTDATAVGQPYIVDRDTNGIIALGATLRTDKDPNNLQWATPNVAADYSNGDVLHISIWDRPDARVIVTLTSDGTLVDTGNSAYIWATATWDEVNDIPDVSEVGNYFKIDETAPSGLDIRLSWRDILNAPWVLTDGSNVTTALREALSIDETLTDAQITTATKMMLEDFKNITLGEIYEHHDQFHTGFTNLTGYNFKTGTQTPAAGDVAYSPAIQGSQTGAYYIKPKDDDDKALLKNILIAKKRVRYWISDSRYIEFKPTGAPGELFGRLVGNYDAESFITKGTALTNNHAVSVEVSSNIPARDEFNAIAFGDFLDVALTTPQLSDSVPYWDGSVSGVRRFTLTALKSLIAPVDSDVTPIVNQIYTWFFPEDDCFNRTFKTAFTSGTEGEAVQMTNQTPPSGQGSNITDYISVERDTDIKEIENIKAGDYIMLEYSTNVLIARIEYRDRFTDQSNDGVRFWYDKTKIVYSSGLDSNRKIGTGAGKICFHRVIPARPIISIWTDGDGTDGTDTEHAILTGLGDSDFLSISVAAGGGSPGDNHDVWQGYYNHIPLSSPGIVLDSTSGINDTILAKVRASSGSVLVRARSGTTVFAYKVN